MSTKKKVLAGIAIVAVLAAGFFGTQEIVKVVGRSMEPAIKNGEYKLVNKWGYLLAPIRRGDIVYYQSTGKEGFVAVGRVVGLPYEMIEFKEKAVWADGKKLEEPYLAESVETFAASEKNSIGLNKDEYAILGDNRPRSRDSRQDGAVKRTNIKGKFWQ